MNRARFAWLVALAFAACPGGALDLAPLSAAEPEQLDPAALVARERIRSEVDTILERFEQPIEDPDLGYQSFLDTAHELAALGPEAAPFLIEELEQEQIGTYVVVTYALGLLPTPETEKALRDAMQRADKQEGSFPWARKGWAGIALAMQRVEDAIDLPVAGNRAQGQFAVFRNMSLLEYAAILTEPRSHERLLKLFDRFEHEENTGQGPLQVRYVLRAMRWVAIPESLPRIARALENAPTTIRVEAARALSTIETPESIRLLVAALAQEEPTVRRAAALAFEKVRPKNKLSLWTERLEVEDDPLTRAPLYRLVALDGGSAGAKKLARYAWSKDAVDRMHLVRALGLTGADDALPLLEVALADSDLRVSVNAATTLHGMKSPGATKRLRRALDTASPDVVLEAAERLALTGDRESVPRIAALLEREMAPDRAADPLTRHRVEVLGRALVRLDGAAGEELRKRLASFAHPSTEEFRQGILRQLDAIAAHGSDVAAWTTAADSPNPEVRLLAYRKLGELGGDAAAAALASAFGRVAADEGAAILDALGDVDSPRAAETLERVLTDPAFGGIPRKPLRRSAAWAARRLERADLLRRAIEASDGRDAWPMIYLAVLEGERALPLLAEKRIPRLLHLWPERGTEQEKLDWLAREIRAGRSIDVLDIPPNDEIFTLPH